jgi:hypothetical protein
MNKIADALKHDSPLTLAKEFAWRLGKKHRRARFLSSLASGSADVRFRNIPYYQPDMSHLSGKSRSLIVSFAEELCEGRYPLLSYGTLDLGNNPKWNVDWISGLDWPSNRPLENHTSIRFDGSDIKAPYELARLQFLPVLGKAYILTQSSRYRETAKAILSDWLRQNPAPFGIHWSLAMEVALRAISICLLLNLLAPFGKDEQVWLDRVTESLWQHLNYIEGHLEFSHRVRSNHYLSNILGIYCIASFLEGEGMQARRGLHSRNLETELSEQVHADGGDFEASSGYHVLVTQMFTTGYHLFRANGQKPSRAYSERLHSMYQFMATLANPDGVLPHLGDCDDGRVELLQDDLEQMLRLSTTERNSLRVPNQIGIGSALFGGKAGAMDDASWYGVTGTSAMPPICEPAANVTVFPQSGIAVANAGQAQVVFCAVPNGINGKGSHTHNDKLSFVLRMNGEEVLCDSGTGVYTRDPKLRNRLRRTAAHNSVVVDDAEQNTIDFSTSRVFWIGNEAAVSPIQFDETENAISLTASHLGYKARGITHTRRLTLKKEGSTLVVEDFLEGSGSHRFEINFQLAPKWSASLAEQSASSSGVNFLLSGSGQVRLNVSAPVSISGECGEREISTAYCVTTPGAYATIRGTAELPVRITTALSLEGN